MIFVYLRLDGIVAIDKPYGMATTDVDDKNDIVLTHYLPILSKLLKCEELRTVHRLDRDTTGNASLKIF